MRLPIQYAFSWPERWDGALPTLSLLDCRRLEFEAPDHDRFPCLRLAYRALEAGDAYPVVLNAANEVAVASFLEGAVPFPAIAGEHRRRPRGRRAPGCAAARDAGGHQGTRCLGPHVY